MTLTINSTHNTRLQLMLNDIEYVREYASPREQDILMSIEHFLDAQGKTLKDLTAITVTTGPGHFTSLRLGIAIAQALSFALQIPINGQPAGTTIVPNYGAEPSITKNKYTT